MSTTITGKLNNNANEFQAGESTGFGFRLGVQYYDRTSKQKEWTNYEGVLFSGNDNQISFLRDNLVKDSVITISAKTLQIKTFDGESGQKITIGLNDCNLDYVVSGNSANQQAVQNGEQMAQQQGRAPQQASQAPQAKDYTREIAAYWATAEGTQREAHWTGLDNKTREAIVKANT